MDQTESPLSLPPRKCQRFDSPEQEAFLHLWRTYDRLRLVEDELFDRHDLTAQQYNALRVLRAVYPGKMRTLSLAARLVSRAPDITRLLDKLHDRGLIDRERPAENRRLVNVGITESGRVLLDQLDEAVRECHRWQIGHLSAEDMQTLVALLRKARAPHESPDSDWH